MEEAERCHDLTPSITDAQGIASALEEAEADTGCDHEPRGRYIWMQDEAVDGHGNTELCRQGHEYRLGGGM